uniref:Uncharacterized protein n=1 Tax=viral metagenome TaxID=1070528 RepID=A0A6C0EYP3_9ZZZZ
MDLEELNRQMFALQNEFKQPSSPILSSPKPSSSNPPFPTSLPTSLPTSFPNSNAINFQEVKNTMETTQIKRPSKSGDHRADINDKLSSMNTMPFLPQDMINNPPNYMPAQNTRNNSNYEYSQGQQYQQQNPSYQQQQPYQHQQSYSQAQQQSFPQQQNSVEPEANNYSNFANYYNHNFDTLQPNYNPMSNHPASPDIHMNSDNNSNHYMDTHSSGMNMMNVRNMVIAAAPTSNKIYESGFNKIEEKKIDYRQNMNSKLGDFRFDNPNSIEPNPILLQAQANQNIYGQTKDTRMVIQDSNKDYYRQSSNDRMTQYSPLSRASNIPISIANMSVNDFYANMNQGSGGPNTYQQQQQQNQQSQQQYRNQSQVEPSLKDSMNSRMGDYAPLAKTIQYQMNNGQGSPALNSVPQLQQRPTQQTQQTHKTQQTSVQPKLPQWNPTDVNGKLKNVVFKDLPVISNPER